MKNAKHGKAEFQQHAQRGYTLIESAIVLLILSLIISTFISAYRIYMRTEQQVTTVNNMSQIVQNIEKSFLVQKGRYPCPASLTVGRDKDEYGIETVCDSANVADYPIKDHSAAIAPGTCYMGICIEEAITPITSGPYIGQKMRVRRGAVPFRSMGLREEYSLDGYGNRLQYVVTEILAGNASKFDKKLAAISIYDGTGRSLQVASNGVTEAPLQYFVFSSGIDRVGAYSKEGIAGLPCTGTSLDVENCNTSLTNKTAKYSAAEYSEALGAKHFDDIVQFTSTADTPLWRVTDDTGFHIRDLVDAETATGGKIGVGATSVSAATQTEVEVSGDMRSTGLNVNNKICDTNGANCFTPGLVGGNSGDYNCALGYVTGFHSDRVNCAILPSVTCPAGSIMTGISASGALVCTAVVGCTSKSISLCSPDTYTLSAGVQGQVVTTPVSGLSYKETWKCDSSATWTRQSTSGICSCTAVNETYTQDCNSYKGLGNWTGVVTWQHTHTCPANGDTYTKLSDTCVCAPKTYSSAGSCGTGYTGTITSQQQWTCSSPTSGTMGSSTVVSNTCTCGTQPDQVDPTPPSCPDGYTGSITRKRSWVCAGNVGTWGPYVETSNTCTCGGATRSQSIGCVSPLVGNRQQMATYDCATNTWGPWVTYNDNCGALLYTWHSTSGSTGSGSSSYSNSVGGTCSTPGATAACSESAGGGIYSYYPSCVCQ